MDIFWQNMGKRTVIFPWKIGKEGHFLTFLPKIYCSFDIIDVFWPNMGLSAEGFSRKFWEKMTWDYSFFERMDVFLTNMGWSAFLKTRRIFDEILAWEQRFFLEKSEKKGILLTFLDLKIV